MRTNPGRKKTVDAKALWQIRAFELKGTRNWRNRPFKSMRN